TTPMKLPVTRPPTNASEAIGNMSAKRLPLHVPGRLHRVEEVRRLLVAEAIVVVVVLQVAVASHGSHRTSELLSDRAVHLQGPQLSAAVVVIDDEGVIDGEDRGVDLDIAAAVRGARAVDPAVALALRGLGRNRAVGAAEVGGRANRVLDPDEVVR